MTALVLDLHNPDVMARLEKMKRVKLSYCEWWLLMLLYYQIMKLQNVQKMYNAM